MLFLKTWEEDRWESLLSELALEIERGLVTWSSTSGWQPPLSGEAVPDDPVAFLDAFANVYRYVSDLIRGRLARTSPDPLMLDYPTVDDGLRGMLFIDALLASARSRAKWTRVPAR